MDLIVALMAYLVALAGGLAWLVHLANRRADVSGDGIESPRRDSQRSR